MINFTPDFRKIYLKFNLYYCWVSIFLFLPLISQAQFVRKGDAVKISDKCYKITEDKLNRYGSIWWENKIDLRQPFELNFILYLGTKNVNGADGIAFLFHNDSRGFNATGAVAGGLGYGVAAEFPDTPPIQPSVAIEFDTYDNNNDEYNQGFDYGDIPADHSTVVYNGDVSHPAFPPVWINQDNSDVENNQCQNYRIVWNPATKELKLYFNEKLRFSHTGDLINEVFGGESLVYYGFTGSTGGLSNEQTLCLVDPESTPVALGDAATTEPNKPVTIAVTTNDSHTDNEPIAISRIATNPANGQVSIEGGNIIYTPKVGFVGTDTFTYEVCEASSTKCYSKCATAIVTVTVACQVTLTPHTITASGSTTICENGSVTLSVPQQEGIIYQWKKDGHNTGTNSNSLIVSEKGLYAIEFSNNCGRMNGSNTVSIRQESPLQPVTIMASGPTTLCDQESVVLSVPEEAGVFYQWKKDGENIGSNSHNFTATQSGIYSIAVSNSCGTANGNNTVSINKIFAPLPVSITAMGPTTVCGNGSVLLSVPEQAGISYQWKKDGENIGTNNHTFTAIAGGTYSIEIFNSCGKAEGRNSLTFTVTPSPLKPTIKAAGPTTFCQTGDESVLLSVPAQNGIRYQWQKNGQNVGADSPTLTVKESGEYSLILTNSCNETSISSNTIAVVAQNQPAAPKITASGSTEICTGGSVTLTAFTGGNAPAESNPDYQYRWSTGATGPSLTTSQAGVYTVTLTTAAGCEVSSAPIKVTLIPALQAPEITANGATTVCGTGQLNLSVPEQPGAIYHWQRNGQPTGPNSNTLVATESGVYTIELSNACSKVSGSNSVTFTLSPNPEPVTIVADGPTTFCGTGSVNLSVPEQAGITYQWQKDGQNVGTNKNTLTATETGEYSLLLTNNCGTVIANNKIRVTGGSQILAPQIVNGQRCGPGSVTLNASGAKDGEYHWYTSATSATPINNATKSAYATPVLQTNTTYYVSIAQNGCESDRVPVTATLLEVPTVTVSPDLTINGGESTNLKATGGNTYIWQPATGLSGATEANPTARPTETTTYTVTATNAAGCTSQAQVTVTVRQDLIIPTAISPNGDGVNETWEIANIQNFPQAHIEIFNRWGNKIYDTTGYRNTWDGTWKGSPLPVGTYFYVITLEKGRKLTGPISIVH